ncbi:MAG: helix-turn-helix transcriptional regulator [Clostridiales bacterium]|nr:helix-turn-helix transcriptional regulator [Clostridiales bacterium]
MITDFGKLLRIIRINSGDSSKTMAKKLNLSPSYLSAIENGKRNIPVDMEKQLCSAYPLSEIDKEKIHKAIYSSSDTIKINLTDFAEKKQKLIFAITRDDISDDTIDKMFNLIVEEKAAK